MVMNSFRSQTPQQHFENLGFGGGGLFPVLMMAVAGLVGTNAILAPDSHDAVLIVSGIFIVYGLLHCFFSGKWQGGLETGANLLLPVVSFIALHLIVMLTGGTANSALSLSYIYMVAVVGFTHSKWTLVATAVTASFSGLMNLILLEWQLRVFGPSLGIATENVPSILNFRPDVSGWLYALLYGGVFLTQLWLTFYLAPKGALTEPDASATKANPKPMSVNNASPAKPN